MFTTAYIKYKIHHAKLLNGDMQNLGLELQYKTCYARVLDSKRKFLQAATQYYELSQVENVRSGPGQVTSQPFPVASCVLCAQYASLDVAISHVTTQRHAYAFACNCYSSC